MSEQGPVRWVPKDAFVMPLIPPEVNVDPVLAGLLHCMSFLELSGEKALDPDWAVEAMEHVAHYLQRLGKADIQGIANQVASAVEYARSHGFPDEFVEFLGKFLEHCGLAEERGA